MAMLPPLERKPALTLTTPPWAPFPATAAERKICIGVGVVEVADVASEERSALIWTLLPAPPLAQSSSRFTPGVLGKIPETIVTS